MSFVSLKEMKGLTELQPFSGELTGVSIDSRTVSEGNLFVAIKGDKFDGHNFLDSAISNGAAAVVVSRKWNSENDLPINESVGVYTFVDTLLFLGQYANMHRNLKKQPIVGISGSNGKTTVKEMTALVLSKIGNVHKTKGNLNNHIGVPLTLLEMNDSTDYAVIEMGINHPGEMTYLCSIAEPDVALITNVELTHTEFFGSVDRVAKAKGELFTGMAVGGTAIVNIDDSHIKALAENLDKKLTYSLHVDADMRGKILRIEDDSRAVVEFNGCEPFTLNVLGKKMAENAIAAAAIGLKFAVPLPDICEAIESYRGFKGRMNRLEVAGRIVIDDSYNANPASVEFALNSLSAFTSSSKKIVVIGDMLELGSHSEEEHRQIGRKLSVAGFDAVYAYGTETKATIDEAQKEGSEEAVHFESKEEMTETLMNFSAPGDVILVKGSRGMQMEDVITLMTGSAN